MCGAGAQAPSGPPCTSTTVGDRAVRGIRRRGDPGLDRAAGPGRLGQGHDRHRVAPLPGRPDRRPDAGRARRGATRTDRSIARTPSVPSQLIAPVAGPLVATASEWVTMSPSTSVSMRAGPSQPRRHDGTPSGGPGRSGSPWRRSCRPSARYGPGRLDTIQPLRSVSAHWPIGRSRSGVEVPERPGPVGRSDEEARADVVERLGLVDADRHDPCGRPARSGVVGPAGRGQDLARLGIGRRPRPRPRSWFGAGGPRSGPRAEVNATVRPSGLQAMSDTPQSPEVTWRGVAPGVGVHDEQVRPAVQVADAVPAPVRAGDPSGQRAIGRRGPAAPCRPQRRGTSPDEEPRRVHLGREREPAPVGRPGDLADRPEPGRPDAADAPAARSGRGTGGSARPRRRSGSGRTPRGGRPGRGAASRRARLRS